LLVEKGEVFQLKFATGLKRGGKSILRGSLFRCNAESTSLPFWRVLAEESDGGDLRAAFMKLVSRIWYLIYFGVFEAAGGPT